MKKLLLGVTLAFTACFGASAKAFDVTKIIQKTPAGVKAVLGEPVKKEVVKPSGTPCPCTKLTYKDGTEIVFMKGRADWIDVPIEDLRFAKNALKWVGLKPLSPNHASNFVMRWDKYPGIKSISVFAGRGPKADNLYIKVKTK